VNFGFFIVLAVLFAVMWLLLIRPQRRRTQAQLLMQDRLRAGDEIITAGGLHATIRSIEGDVLEIELAPETVVRLDRRAVAARVSPEEPEEPEEAEPEEPISADDG
jgi:preprotein translocase subunit YajC